LWGLLALVGISTAHASPVRDLGESRSFWVKTLSGYRIAETTLKAVGKRSYIYVEKSLWKKDISPEFVRRLSVTLEEKAPEGAIFPELGLIELQEKIFSPLPQKISTDSRVSIIFANIANNPFIEGYFNPSDQSSTAEAEARGE